MSIFVGFKIGPVKERQAYSSEYYCGGCGWPVSDHDSYCPECGGAFRKEDATERTCTDVKENGQFFKCSECGAIEVTGGLGNYQWWFCPNCGSKIVEFIEVSE